MNLKNVLSIFAPIYIYYVWLPFLGLSIWGVVMYSKIHAEIEMCKIYYPELSAWNCYWSPKVLPQRSGK